MNESIAFRCTQLLSPIVCAPNVGDKSSDTVIVNVNCAASPSASVAFQVYVVST